MDESTAFATSVGAEVKQVHIQSKGVVVSQMFVEREADIYILVDGDDTYPAEESNKILAPKWQMYCLEMNEG